MYVSHSPFIQHRFRFFFSSVVISLPRPLKMQWVVKKKLRGLIKGLRGATCCVGSKHLRWRCSSPLDSSSLPFRDAWEFTLNLTHSFSVSLSLHLTRNRAGKRDKCGCFHARQSCLNWCYVVFINKHLDVLDCLWVTCVLVCVVIIKLIFNILDMDSKISERFNNAF